MGFLRGCVRYGFMAYFNLFYKIDIIGKENIPKEGGYILCSNHMSNLDPVFLGLSQRRQIFFMAKLELFKNKLFAALIRTLGAFPVERGAGDGKAIGTAEEILRKGNVLGIFIEGTRSKTGELLRPKAGASMIAEQTNATVLPVCITPKKQKIRVFSKVTISIGKPMTTEQLGLGGGSPEGYRKASKLIMNEIKAMRERDRGTVRNLEGDKK